MIKFAPLYQQLAADGRLSAWLDTLPQQIDHFLGEKRHGDWTRWQAALDSLPALETRDIDWREGVRIGQDNLTADTRIQLELALRGLSPWRKGPYHVHGIHIDTEWRSDWKWDRVQPHITPLTGRKVLDIGCGNGYHLWRMLAEDPRLVVGIDPSQLFLLQFEAIRRLSGNPDNIWLAPVGVQHLPPVEGWDSVFCMGVLYHRKSPIDLLYQLKSQLRPGGELILETLVVDGDANTALMPTDRYAQMRNVWFLPSVEAMVLWLERCGFVNVRTVDVNQTTVQEQRSTDWMTFDSLQDFLDPTDPSRTIEGYQAPTRAVFIAERPA